MKTVFLIWSFVGLFMIGTGIYDCYAKSIRPFGFWANTKPIEVKDVRAYNKALGKLFIIAGICFVVLGLPLWTAGQNTPWIVFMIVGAMLWAIVVMVVYTVFIEPKHRK